MSTPIHNSKTPYENQQKCTFTTNESNQPLNFEGLKKSIEKFINTIANGNELNFDELKTQHMQILNSDLNDEVKNNLLNQLIKKIAPLIKELPEFIFDEVKYEDMKKLVYLYLSENQNLTVPYCNMYVYCEELASNLMFGIVKEKFEEKFKEIAISSKSGDDDKLAIQCANIVASIVKNKLLSSEQKKALLNDVLINVNPDIKHFPGFIFTSDKLTLKEKMMLACAFARSKPSLKIANEHREFVSHEMKRKMRAAKHQTEEGSPYSFLREYEVNRNGFKGYLCRHYMMIVDKIMTTAKENGEDMQKAYKALLKSMEEENTVITTLEAYGSPEKMDALLFPLFLDPCVPRLTVSFSQKNTNEDRDENFGLTAFILSRSLEEGEVREYYCLLRDPSNEQGHACNLKLRGCQDEVEVAIYDIYVSNNDFHCKLPIDNKNEFLKLEFGEFFKPERIDEYAKNIVTIFNVPAEVQEEYAGKLVASNATWDSLVLAIMHDDVAHIKSVLNSCSDFKDALTQLLNPKFICDVIACCHQLAGIAMVYELVPELEVPINYFSAIYTELKKLNDGIKLERFEELICGLWLANKINTRDIIRCLDIKNVSSETKNLSKNQQRVIYAICAEEFSEKGEIKKLEEALKIADFDERYTIKFAEIAMRAENAEVVIFLLKKGMAQNSRNGLWEKLIKEIIVAAKNGKTDALKFLILNDRISPDEIEGIIKKAAESNSQGLLEIAYMANLDQENGQKRDISKILEDAGAIDELLTYLGYLESLDEKEILVRKAEEAIKYGSPDILQKLIGDGLDINAKGGANKSLIERAFSTYKKPDLVEILLNNGAYFDIQKARRVMDEWHDVDEAVIDKMKDVLNRHEYKNATLFEKATINGKWVFNQIMGI